MEQISLKEKWILKTTENDYSIVAIYRHHKLKAITKLKVEMKNSMRTTTVVMGQWQ